jgi:hypothetical protein
MGLRSVARLGEKKKLGVAENQEAILGSNTCEDKHGKRVMDDPRTHLLNITTKHNQLQWRVATGTRN